MSIKRARPSSQSRGRRDDDAPFFGSGAHGAAAEPEKTWTEHLDGKADDAFVPYALSASFAKGALIQHGVFGRGIVVTVAGRVAEVMFEAGTKKLSHAG